LISGVRCWRGLESTLSPLPTSIWVRAGRIEAVGAEAERAYPGEDRRDARGRFALPGLIDAHVHLELDPSLRTPAEQLALSEPVREAGVATRARAMLRAGITTARDCGGGAHREHALRQRIDSGDALGPRLLCCGQPLTTPGGHCHFWGGEVESEASIRQMIDRQIDAGSDWIKVMATGGVFTKGSSARATQFDRATLTQIVEHARRADRFVAAHCHGTRGIDFALEAGVRTLEHASFAGPDGFGTDLDDALMARIAAAESWVSTTVNGGWGRRLLNKEGAPSDFFLRMSNCLRRQRAAGIRFIASTDAGIPGVEHHDLVSGLIALAQFADLPPVEVLRMATSEAALALGLEAETGRIEPGLSADLLLVDEDPLEDLARLREPSVVVFRGEWHERTAEIPSLREEAR
jgi:imidazolonepropionase-like amidohydrolase